MTPTRRTPRRRIAVAIAAAAAAAVCLASLLSTLRGAEEAPVSWGASGTSSAAGPQAAAGTPSFTISGSPAVALSPGATAPIEVTVQNTSDRDLRVGSLTVGLTEIDAPEATSALPCGREDFVVEQGDGDLVLLVGAGERRALSGAGRAVAPPRVTMIDSATNQDGCKNAVLHFRYTATGTER
jgi:hypothetical protein